MGLCNLSCQRRSLPASQLDAVASAGWTASSSSCSAWLQELREQLKGNLEQLPVDVSAPLPTQAGLSTGGLVAPDLLAGQPYTPGDEDLEEYDPSQWQV